MSYIGANPVVAQVDGYNQTQMDSFLGSQNLLINGAMQVAQRSTSETGLTTVGYHTVDRFHTNIAHGTWTMTQESHTDGPDGHGNSVKLAVTSLAAASGGNSVRLRQIIEAQNCMPLQYGTSSAKNAKFGFWVKCSTTGTYAVSFYVWDANKVVGSTYTINSADTWEYKEITIPADTVSAIANDTGQGMEVNWFLSAGSGITSVDNTSGWATYSTTNYAYGHGVDLANTSGGYLQVTGAQLVPGETLPPFRHEPYGDVLRKCLRYFERFVFSGTMVMNDGVSQSATVAYAMFKFFRKRATPTITVPPGSKTDGASFLTTGGGYPTTAGTNSAGEISDTMFRFQGTGYTGLTGGGQGCYLYATLAQNIDIDAEL